MRKKVLVFFILYLLFSQITIVFAETIEDPLSLTADSAILMDAKTGEILYEKNMHKKQFPASITKLMTALLAIEYNEPQEVITFSKEAIFGIERNSSHIALDVGEQITIEQALYAIMLASANEAALGISEQIGGTTENFAAMMNARATELGCLNTHFVNPNGLHDENHYTTAYDMALITKEVLKYDTFREIAATTYYELPPTNIQPETRYLYAQHKMIKKNSSFYYEDCEGGKTGFTNQALNTLVSFAKRGDTELIAVVLHDAGWGTYTDTTALLDYGFQNFETVKVFSSDSFSKSVSVQQKYRKEILDAGMVDLIAENDIFATLPAPVSLDNLSEKIVCEELLNTPIEKNSVQGSLEIYYNGTKIGSTNLLSQNAVAGLSKEELKQRDYASVFAIVKTISIVAILSLGVLLLLYYTAFFVHHKRMRRKGKRRIRKKYRSHE